MNSIEHMPVSALHPALYNPREADPERLELVKLSLRKLGFLLPLVATVDGEILSGHQRHAVAVSMGVKSVPVLRVQVPDEARRRGLNILFNRATNDIAITATEQDMSKALSSSGVRALAESLPDLDMESPAFFPCMAAEMRDVIPLAQHNALRFVRHAANVGRMLARLHVQLPIVATADGTVINGIGRLEAAARKGKAQIAVITLADDQAALAASMLNLLSMDFQFKGANADFLRFGAFRRPWLRRSHLGTAFVMPVYRHKRLSSVVLDGPFLAKWKAACGDSVLDFGCGHGDEARILREAGIRVTEFEPYPASANTVSRAQGRASALGFLAAVRRKEQFSSIFVSSVLNSVPFPEDREHILRIVAALCGPDTLVYAAARGVKSSAFGWIAHGEAMSERASRACNFPLGMEKGVVLGDLAVSPKAQKFFEEKEFLELFSRHFSSVDVGLMEGMVTARCRKSLYIHPRDLAKSLRFEFNLPYPDGQRMGLARHALEAFSVRLGIPLEDI